MNDLVRVEKIAQWQRLKALVLDSISSPIMRRVYNMALNEFMEVVFECLVLEEGGYCLGMITFLIEQSEIAEKMAGWVDDFQTQVGSIVRLVSC
jgi:hypothetical protein